MPRIFQKKAERGSQKWLQELINNQPDLLLSMLRTKDVIGDDVSVCWLSPLKEDFYAEYQDEFFLKRLEIELKDHALDKFWPSGGPVWDGLGKSESGDIFLIEAKSHKGEFISGPCKAVSEEAKGQIQRALALAAEYFEAKPSADWMQNCYQYANRLAHLYLLRKLNSLPAWMIFIYFVNDSEMDGPGSADQWYQVIADVHQTLGLDADKLAPYVVDLFVDVDDLF